MPNTHKPNSFTMLEGEDSTALEAELLVAVDIGNSTIVVGLFDGSRLIRKLLFASQRTACYRDYSVLLGLELSKIAKLSIRHFVICSVVPQLTEEWKKLAKTDYHASVYEIAAHTALGLSFKVDDPSFIGADLIVNAFAAWKLYQRNCIIVDLGTATTLQVIDSKGSYEGSIILPGLELSLKSLGQAASRLAHIELDLPKELLGTSTEQSILSGVVQGHIYMLNAFIQDLQSSYPAAQVIITGGLASSILTLLDSSFTHMPNLTLQGLYFAFQELQLKQENKIL